VEFDHDDVRDKLEQIGQWLGLGTATERRVATGAKVDVVWEATIGNMGRAIYVFEVQSRGSIDGLLMNLLRATNNPAVQGVVAVSDLDQIETMKQESASVPGLHGKLKFWNYAEVLRVHANLEYVRECISTLGLVPQGF
jgi:hypothetical protein